jgi:hypothetical protein
MKPYVQTALSIITSLRMAGFNAVVAGGYLRDSILGLEPKDIDVFLPRTDLTTEQMEETLTRVMVQSVTCEFNLSYANMEARRVFTTLPNWGALPIQFVELSEGTDPKERVLEHDFGICQVWVDMDGLHTTGFFDVDQAQRTCTLVYCESEVEWKRSMRRWDRLKEKLTGFRLMDNTGYAPGTRLELPF